MVDTQKAPTAQPVQQQQTQQAQQPVVSPGGGRKESVSSVGLTQEWVSQSAPEIVLPKEVEDAGVESQPFIPAISQSAQAAGVSRAKESTPTPSIAAEPLGLQTPRTVLDHLKTAHKNVKDSLSWLVRLILKEQDKKEKGAQL